MKKKIIILISFFTFLILSYYIYNHFSSNQNALSLQKSNTSDEEIIDDSDSAELFGSNYKKALAKMKDMSLEEKIGQLFLVRYDNNLANSYIDKYHVGGFVLFAKDFKDITKDDMSTVISNHQKRSSIPLVMAVDEEGGFVTRVSRFPAFRDSKFLAPKDYYEKGGYELLENVETEKAKLLKSIGLNLNLAPVADISTDPNDFVYSRSFGHNAEDTSVFISNMVGYANDNNISSCLKHFPGYGNNADTHTGVAIDNREYNTFVTNDYLPFQAGINVKVPFILVSHNVVVSIDGDYPASLSKKVITDELRTKLGFSGIIITDDLDMEAVKSYVDGGNAATFAVNAGADMIITSDFTQMYNEILDAVNNNVITEETINRAVKRIIAWKYTYDLF